MRTLLVSHIKRSGEINAVFQMVLKWNDLDAVKEFLNYLSYTDKKNLLEDDVDYHQNFPYLYALKYLSKDMAMLMFEQNKDTIKMLNKEQEFSWKPNSSRENALMIACAKGYEDMVESLLSIYQESGQRSSITKQDNEGLNSLMLAAKNGYFEIVTLLLPHFEKNGSTTKENKKGQNAVDLSHLGRQEIGVGEHNRVLDILRPYFAVHNNICE